MTPKQCFFRILIIPLLLIIVGMEVYAQDSSRVKITGKVISGQKEKAVPFVHIINSQNQAGTVSKEDGSFAIEMGKEDTLIFSAIGYHNYRFSLKKGFDDKQLFIKINLNEKTFELNPVTVYAFRDENDFKQAILNLKNLPDKNASIDIPGSYNGPEKSPNKGFEFSGNGIAFVGPFSSIQNMFSKEAKEVKKLRKIKKKEKNRTLIEDKYNKSVVRDFTGLKGDSLNQFMNFCKISDRFIERATEYEILAAIDNCFKNFKDFKDDARN